MANIISRAAVAIGKPFGIGGGKGSRVVSQNRAARMGRKAAGRKAVRLPAAPVGAKHYTAVKGAARGARGGASKSGSGVASP